MFSFVKKRKQFYIIAVALSAISALSPFIIDVNLGIDMTGGIQIEYTTEGGDPTMAEATAKEYAEAIKKTIVFEEKPIMNDVSVYGIAGSDSFIVEAGFTTPENASEADIEKLKTQFSTTLTEKLASYQWVRITQSRYVNIGESFGAYIKKSGYITLAISILMISLYIQYAFRGSIAGMASWPFAFVTAVSLMHDVLVAFGLYVITSFFFPEFKIDTFFLTALLTILGYSINDTIVVMDRIRSNLHNGELKKTSFSDIIDRSIHDTMRRSLLTPMTVLIVLVALFFFGPTSLKGFMLALIYGTIVGTYSSIFIASPLLVDITKKK